MQRYSTVSKKTQGLIDQKAQQKEISSKPRLKNRRQPFKKDKFARADLHTIDISSIPSYSTNSEEKKRVAQSFGPCVGDYQISSPIVKPCYETYQKNDQVILVKINHFGGTSSFRNQGERFADANSIYQSNRSPGPGSYHFADKSSSKKQNFSTSHHENYDIIQELLRSNRERTQSLPCYTLEAKKGWEYNGVPKHLQQMYQKIKEKGQETLQKSIPLQKLIRLKKRKERLPVINNKEEQKEIEVPNYSKSSEKMTSTIYRLQEDNRKKDQRILKIRQLLKQDNQSKNKQTFRAESGKKNKHAVFAKNMVNMLYQIRDK